MDARRLGPVVGLGTFGTFAADAPLTVEVVGAALAAGVTRVSRSRCRHVTRSAIP